MKTVRPPTSDIRLKTSGYHRVADMKVKGKSKVLSEEEIDKIVISQANHDSSWEKPVRVRRAKRASLSLPSDLATRVAFFARLHREMNMENWLRRIIQERIDLEEAAFTGLKRDLSPKNSA